MTFGAAMVETTAGGAVRRPDWPVQDHVKLYPILVGGERTLTIFREEDQKYHPWTIVEADMTAGDYVRMLPVDVGPRPVDSVQSAVAVPPAGSPHRVQ